MDFLGGLGPKKGLELPWKGGPEVADAGGALVPKFARRGEPVDPPIPERTGPVPGLRECYRAEAEPARSVWLKDSRGIGAAHHRRWAAYTLSLGFRVRVKDLGLSVSISGRARGVRLFFRVRGAHPIARLRSLVVPPQPPKLCSVRV